MTGPNDYVLAIEAGLYAGTSQSLPAGTYVIGGGVEADMVFMGEGLAPRHVLVAIDGGEARVEALADGVVLAGYGPLEAGHAVAVALPFELSIAGLLLSWTRTTSEPDTNAGGPRGLGRLSSHLVRSAVGISLVAVAVALIASNPVADASVPTGGLAEIRKPAGAMTAAGAAGSEFTAQLTAPPAGMMKDAAEALRAEVEKAGLLNVAVDASGGVVTAQGTVEPNAAGRWQSVQQWFDERFRGEVTLINGVAVKAEKVPSSLGIEAVWRGQQSHLVIRGQKFLEGAVLDDGWTIHRIEAERVVLKRDGRLVAVRY